MLKCPVHECFKTFATESAFKAHFKETHQYLIDMGLDIGSVANAPGGNGGRFKISNQLINQLIVMGLIQKETVKKIAKEQEEVLENHDF